MIESQETELERLRSEVTRLRRIVQERGKADEAELPKELATPAFQALWGLWLEFRRVELRKPVTPISAKMSLKALSAMGLERAMAAIEHTIANGWQGIREPDQPRMQNPLHNLGDSPIRDLSRGMRELGL